MVNKRNTQAAPGPETMDDAWWAALLSEESKYGSSSSSRPQPAVETPAQSKPAPPERADASSTAPAPVNWERVQKYYTQDETLHLKVTGANRGGLLVDGDGLHGFVPVSHLVDISAEAGDAEREKALGGYVGQILCLKVIECEPDRQRVVFSQRAALAGNGRRNQLLEALTIGQCVEGVVTNITDFGVFVDLGGIEGLVHISELSWGRVQHPDETVSIGERVNSLVISIDKEHARVALSLKRLHPNPWDTAEARYFPGQVTEAIITSVVPFGAFARLEEGLDGLIHISEMKLGDGKVSPQDLFIEGQRVRVRVLHVNAGRQRLGLSLCEELGS